MRPADAGDGGGQRRRRLLVPAERLARRSARRSRASRRSPRASRATRRSPGSVLTNGDLDHCLGLLSLRESHPLTVYATESVRTGFTGGNVLYRTLERFDGQVTWRALSVERNAPDARAQPLGDSGLTVTAIATPGKLPLHLESSCDAVARGQRRARDSRHPHAAGGWRISPAWPARRRRSRGRCADADALFFDGTFWSSDELIAAGLGTRRAEDMAHWPVGGRRGERGVSGGPARPEDPDPHQQHQSDSARDQRRTTGARRRGDRGRRRRPGAVAVSAGADCRRCCRPTSSWRGCAPKGCAATTTSIRSTSGCTRASCRARSCRAGR